MDAAVALVQSYLRVNGYFTVTEFPIVELMGGTDYRTATDLDLLACRFPDATRAVIHGGPGGGLSSPDPALKVPKNDVDMIVGEVKESLAEFNPGALKKDVLAAALHRFGCCGPEDPPDEVALQLVSRGETRTGGGHLVRLVAFGAKTGPQRSYLQIGLHRVVGFLEEYVRKNWDVLRHVDTKDRALSFLMLREKARRGKRSG